MVPDAGAWGLPDLLGVLNLERIDADLYRSQAAGEPGHRLFGGQVAHNEVRLDDWLLFAKSTPAAGAMRGLAQGSIFHRDGTLIATVVQEGLAHSSRPGESVRPI